MGNLGMDVQKVLQQRSTIGLGKLGEKLATRVLQEHGYVILEKNYRCALGEVDIIARENDEIVFVEVKTRRNTRFGLPEEAVNMMKQKKIIGVAQNYLLRHHLETQKWRIDVVAIEASKDTGRALVRIHRNAVEEYS